MSDTPALAIRDVRYAYGEHEAVRGVSFSVATGEVFALLGPNGSGKTTLFRLISTLVPLQAGDIRVLGASVRDQAAAVRGQLGVVFQAPSVDKKLTVLENMVHHGRLYGVPSSQLKQKARSMVERLGLGEEARRNGRNTVGRPASAGGIGAGHVARPTHVGARRTGDRS